MLLHPTSSRKVQIPRSDAPVQRKKYELGRRPPKIAGRRRLVRHIASQIPGGRGVPIGVLLLQRLPATKEFGSSHSLLRSRGVPRAGWLVVPAYRRNQRAQGVHTRTPDRRKGGVGALSAYEGPSARAVSVSEHKRRPRGVLEQRQDAQMEPQRPPMARLDRLPVSSPPWNGYTREGDDAIFR